MRNNEATKRNRNKTKRNRRGNPKPEKHSDEAVKRNHNNNKKIVTKQNETKRQKTKQTR